MTIENLYELQKGVLFSDIYFCNQFFLKLSQSET